MRKILYAVNHWTASGTHTTVAMIRSWHVHGNGWKDIGYHRVILHPDSPELAHLDKDSMIWSDLVKLGRPLDSDPYLEAHEMGAHARGFNRDTVGIVTVGGPGIPLHPLQKEAIVEVNKIFAQRFKYSITKIKGHQELKGHTSNACPGPEVMTTIRALRAGYL